MHKYSLMDTSSWIVHEPKNIYCGCVSVLKLRSEGCKFESQHRSNEGETFNLELMNMCVKANNFHTYFIN